MEHPKNLCPSERRLRTTNLPPQEHGELVTVPGGVPTGRVGTVGRDVEGDEIRELVIEGRGVTDDEVGFFLVSSYAP